MSSLTFAQSEHKIINRIALKDEGGWDYLTADEAPNRLFVSRGTSVQVVDLKGKRAGTITDLKRVRGLAIAQDLNKAYISCGD